MRATVSTSPRVAASASAIAAKAEFLLFKKLLALRLPPDVTRLRGGIALGTGADADLTVDLAQLRLEARDLLLEDGEPGVGRLHEVADLRCGPQLGQLGADLGTLGDKLCRSCHGFSFGGGLSLAASARAAARSRR
jgi:hypothetical protein